MGDDYSTFIPQIKRKIGIDLHLYKETQMKRRLTSLRNQKGYATFTDYFQAMEKDRTLLDEFIDRITINVSEFYRNPKRWDVLQKNIIPLLLHQQKDSTFTIWSAACSTGEEPYSMAMMMHTYFPQVRVRILATDLDEGALEKAKTGIYQKNALKDLPPVLEKKYFTEKQDLFHLTSTIKNMVSFKKHNLLADPYPKQVDLIICRNVLIYFTDEAKEQIYQSFSASLRHEGVLFVGSTEQIFHPTSYDLSLLDTFYYQKQ